MDLEELVVKAGILFFECPFAWLMSVRVVRLASLSACGGLCMQGEFCHMPLYRPPQKAGPNQPSCGLQMTVHRKQVLMHRNSKGSDSTGMGSGNRIAPDSRALRAHDFSTPAPPRSHLSLPLQDSLGDAKDVILQLFFDLT